MDLLLVTGFLSSGKTRFINEYQEYDKRKKRIVRREWGETEGIGVEEGEGSAEDFSLSEHLHLAEAEGAEVLVIEWNGMEPLGPLIRELEESEAARKIRRWSAVELVRPDHYDLMRRALPESARERIAFAHEVLVLDDGDTEELLRNLEQEWMRINPAVEIIEVSELKRYFRPLAPSVWKDRLFFLIFMLAGFFFLKFLADYAGALVLSEHIGRTLTVFFGILLEAFPFLMMGVLISSAIQVFVSREMILKLFPVGKVRSTLLALVAGLFLPVCDCATVPVVTGLLAKGVPVSAGITFMLAAPILNPIVLASTWFAFRGDPSVLLYRVGAGLFVAFLTGLCFSKRSLREILTERKFATPCGCSYCAQSTESRSLSDRCRGMLNHAGFEFFNVGRYLVVGAFLSSIFQVFGADRLAERGGMGGIGEMLLLLMLAFLLSLCSSSDAFVAKIFIRNFSAPAVMTFLVFGPMMDLKNMLLLSASFKKRFVLVLTLLLAGFTLLIVWLLGQMDFFQGVFS